MTDYPSEDENAAARRSLAEFALANGDAEAWKPTLPETCTECGGWCRCAPFRAKVESFKYAAGGGHRSALFPGYLIRPRIIGPVGYYVFRDDIVSGPMGTAYSFEAAVAMVSNDHAVRSPRPTTSNLPTEN